MVMNDEQSQSSLVRAHNYFYCVAKLRTTFWGFRYFWGFHFESFDFLRFSFWGFRFLRFSNRFWGFSFEVFDFWGFHQPVFLRAGSVFQYQILKIFLSQKRLFSTKADANRTRNRKRKKPKRNFRNWISTESQTKIQKADGFGVFLCIIIPVQ